METVNKSFSVETPRFSFDQMRSVYADLSRNPLLSTRQVGQLLAESQPTLQGFILRLTQIMPSPTAANDGAAFTVRLFMLASPLIPIVLPSHIADPLTESELKEMQVKNPDFMQFIDEHLASNMTLEEQVSFAITAKNVYAVLSRTFQRKV